MYKPEANYDKPTPLSVADVEAAYEAGTTLTGIVRQILPDERIIKVELGGFIVAQMPFEEATMYPLRYSKNEHSRIPSNIRNLLNKPVRVKVTEVAEHNITVSRKKNMCEAYTHLRDAKTLTFRVTHIKPLVAFGDVGDGVIGVIHIKNVSRCHRKHIGEVLKLNSTYTAAVMGVDDQNYIRLSIMQLAKPYDKADYPAGTLVQGTIRGWVEMSEKNNIRGRYIDITPTVSGIMNVDGMNTKYGEIVECLVTKSTDNGLRLKFVRYV